MVTKMLSVTPVAGAVLSACLFTAVSCNTDKKEKPEATAAAPAAKESSSGEGTRSVALIPGEAGGVLEESFTAHATVRGVDKSTRKVTLESEDGTKASFTAPPEMRNIDQLKVGDRVKATIAQRIVISVNSGSAAPSEAHAAMVARAPKGAKPGAIVAESFEVVSTVKAIDSAARRATLQFSDGSTKSVPVRADVDLGKYKVGDTVVIRVTEQLSVLTSSP
jgi:Cu/Ag efflux protein CusF